ncbi:MAG: IS1634 family transposase [Deltaproteobacteria bacterium]|nr:IS1634 family transposase [Deltaproteobacteria bacterium]
MHLGYSTSTYKRQKYKSYVIAESYRDGKTVRKRIIWRLGKLTDEQAEQIRLILEVVQSEDQVVTRLKDIVLQETRSYLDIAVVNALWDQWQLDGAFTCDVTESVLPTNTMARILTINRCTDPCSHYSVPMWAQKIALKEVLGFDLSGLNDDKIYYELDKIHKNKVSIENYLFKRIYGDKPESFDFVNYDLSTTYFVGYKCNLSAFGKGKAECHGRRQVLLGVLINDEGYPFKWDVFPGNTAEVKTLRTNINACKTRFGLGQKNVTLVFDRGIISDDNASLIEDAQMKYISALDRNQIPGCGVSLEPFKGLVAENEPLPAGFKKYDDQLYFKDAGVMNNKRYVLGFNPTFFREDRKNRDEKISLFLDYLKKENKDLKTARRDRDFEATKSRVIKELKRHKIRKYFDPPVLKPLIVQRKLKNGTVKDIKSFQVQISKNTDVIESDKLLDGVCVFITNHIEKQGRGFKVKPQSIIKAYREKTKIEDVFKNVKSFLKLRPFFVNTEAHVKAVYTICILAYFINRYLANQRKSTGENDYLNSKELYAPFKDIDIATLEGSRSGYMFTKAVKLPEITRALLEKLSLPQIAIDPQQ